MAIKVFVYGSLLSGFGNHSYLEASKLVGVGYIKNATLHSLGAFPAIQPSDPSSNATNTVWGELYEIDEATFASLDRLESHPSFYKRRETEVWLDNERHYDDPKPQTAWAYWLTYDSGNEVIATGDWRWHEQGPYGISHF